MLKSYSYEDLAVPCDLNKGTMQSTPRGPLSERFRQAANRSKFGPGKYPPTPVPPSTLSKFVSNMMHRMHVSQRKSNGKSINRGFEKPIQSNNVSFASPPRKRTLNYPKSSILHERTGIHRSIGSNPFSSEPFKNLTQPGTSLAEGLQKTKLQTVTHAKRDGFNFQSGRIPKVNSAGTVDTIDLPSARESPARNYTPTILKPRWPEKPPPPHSEAIHKQAPPFSFAAEPDVTQFGKTGAPRTPFLPHRPSTLRNVARVNWRSSDPSPPRIETSFSESFFLDGITESDEDRRSYSFGKPDCAPHQQFVHKEQRSIKRENGRISRFGTPLIGDRTLYLHEIATPSFVLRDSP
jgi:hypothetical protein